VIRARVVRSLTAVAFIATCGCGADVDLGGGSDAGLADGASAPPTGADGGPAEHCGALDAPQVPSTCRACELDAGDCQPNGCYGGYWCDAQKSDCAPPPKTCP
jgi:hypothetical protein